MSESLKQIQEDLFNLHEGQLVTHIKHGVGRYSSLKSIVVEGIMRDFIEIFYKGGDKFYLPVENLELLSKYGFELSDDHLDKLGSTSWKRRKENTKKKIKLAATELISVAAARNMIKSPVLTAEDGIYQEFCKSFPYQETEDQIKAIEDILEDISSTTPADRLICADVGFGKTEVALRAIATAVLGNKPVQVAFLVPTTLLARQHYETLTKRFQDFPVVIRQLSKFTSTKENKLTKTALKEGRVDIIVGTHSLLSSSIGFQNLGLVVIDEEQHFGVTQKEKLKKIKNNCHIMTLSATPIPRTLQMSLSGIKDISIIATPPNNRLPVKININNFSKTIIKDAILHEINRTGIIFYVSPRIEYLDEIKLDLRKIVPNAKVRIAHGKMNATELEEIMSDFYDGKFDILLSTAIVESGLDIHHANTIIIDRAHMFGLSQLYQMKGRVGRSDIQGFAYFTYPKGIKLTEDATKRLDVIKYAEDLGSGFSISTADMDIRRHGNLIGENQSGHVKDIGVELYQKMLSQEIATIRNQSDSDTNSQTQKEDWSPNINIGVSFHIPESYIKNTSKRVVIYRRIANSKNNQEIEDLKLSIEDEFGTIPESLNNLFMVIDLKIIAKKLNINGIKIGKKGLVITFHESIPKYYDTLMDFIANHNNVKLETDGRLIVFANWQKIQNKICNIKKILNSLQNF